MASEFRSVAFIPLQIKQPRKGWRRIFDFVFGIHMIQNPNKFAGRYIALSNDKEILSSDDGYTWILSTA